MGETSQPQDDYGRLVFIMSSKSLEGRRNARKFIETMADDKKRTGVIVAGLGIIAVSLVVSYAMHISPLAFTLIFAAAVVFTLLLILWAAKIL